jgi:glycosyltransferase involved in cell wall biosynthesis
MSSRPLRIIHTTSSLNGGGMEHFVLRLAEAQRKGGHDARVLALQGGPLQEHADRLGIPTIVLGGASTPSRVVRGAAALARLRPHIMHSHNPTSLQYGVIGKLVSGARLVFTDHRGIVRVPHTIEWLLTDAVVAVSRDTARQSPASKVVDVGVIYNGVDPPAPKRSRAAVRADLGLGEGPVALHVANFLPVKGHDILVRALAKVRDRGVKLTVVTAGDGDERPAIEAAAAQLGLGPDRLRFLGFRTDVPDLLAAADLFVLPSRMEGLPLATLEAMSHGLPIVTTRIGGNPEVVTDGEHGLLVPVEDPDALAAALARLAEDPALRRALGEAGRTRVQTEFTFTEMTRRYQAIYDRLRPTRPDERS